MGEEKKGRWVNWLSERKWMKLKEWINGVKWSEGMNWIERKRREEKVVFNRDYALVGIIDAWKFWCVTS